MSTLEERREARRRRRQMEEEMIRNGEMTPEMLEANIQARLERRRQERMAAMMASTDTTAVNGEDDFERRRRERREARLRQEEKRAGADDTPSEDFSSRRERRRRQQEESNDTEEVSSYRSRRRRGGDEEEEVSSYRSRRHRGGEDEIPTVNDTSAQDAEAEEEARRQRAREQARQEEEEAARREQEREEEEERQRQAREAQRRAEEEEDRRREEERLRKEQEAFEVLEKQMEELHIEETVEKIDSHDEVPQVEVKITLRNSKVRDEEEENEGRKTSMSERVGSVQQWSQEEEENKGSRISQNLDKDAEFSNKVKEKREKFENIRDEEQKKGRSPSSVIPTPKKEGLKERLQKFEKEIENAGKTSAKEHLGGAGDDFHVVRKISQKLQKFETQSSNETKPHVSPSETNRPPPKPEKKIFNPGGHSLKDIQKRFDGSGSVERISQRQSSLGRWSASESQIDHSPQSEENRRSVLNRWKHSMDEPKQEQKSPVKSPAETKEQLSHRLSGNTEYKTSRFLEKASPTSVVSAYTVQEKTSPLLNGDKGHSSQSSETLTNVSSSEPGPKVTDRWKPKSPRSPRSPEPTSPELRSNVMDRWQPRSPELSPSPTKSWRSSSGAHSRGSSYDNTHSQGSSIYNSVIHSRGSSYDASSDSGLRSPSFEQKHTYNDNQEEEERLEQERLEQEQQEAEEAARMAAEQEKPKKKGKRKGLGGLSPEKKKLLKQIIMQKAAEDLRNEALAKAEEKEKYINERIVPITTDGLGEGELKALCKQLHAKIAQMEEEVYDWEYKIRKQDIEVNELTLKVNDSKGKFAKPVLRKVNKTESKLSKIHKKDKADFRDNLKSSGQNKFGIDEETPETKAE